MTAIGPNTTPANSAFIQRDCNFKPSVAEEGEILRIFELQGTTINRYVGAQPG